jgi:hypothetical protein
MSTLVLWIDINKKSADWMAFFDTTPKMQWRADNKNDRDHIC